MRKTPVALYLIVAFSLLFGCASVDNAVSHKDLQVVDYYVSSNPETSRTQEVFNSFDGSSLAYLKHTNVNREAKIALVYLHGIESHAGWFDKAADLLAQRGYDIYCMDRRGSGLNRENRGYISGHVDSYDIFFKDINHFVKPLHKSYESVYLVGLSWGGKLAFGYALSKPETVDGLILITPGIFSLVDVEFLTKMRIFVNSGMAKTRSFKIPIEPDMFTSTPEYLELIRKDPLRLRFATARFFLESKRLEDYIVNQAATNELPIQLFLAGNDRIVDNSAVVALLYKGRQEILDEHVYADQTHSIQFDATKRLVDDMTLWLQMRSKP